MQRKMTCPYGNMSGKVILNIKGFECWNVCRECSILSFATKTGWTVIMTLVTVNKETLIF